MQTQMCKDFLNINDKPMKTKCIQSKDVHMHSHTGVYNVITGSNQTLTITI